MKRSKISLQHNKRYLISIFLIAFVNLLIFGEELKSGDLIFQISGNSDFSNAISGATHQKEQLDLVHVGIIEVLQNGEINVIEASPEEGVRIISLLSFLTNSPKMDGRYGVVIKRLKEFICVENILNRAKRHLGEPYDWWYLPDNGKMYCSELVYESYQNRNGEKIFESQPMNFRNSDGTISDFWVKLFKQIGSEIPEGVAGTNPNSMSSSSLLYTVPIDFSFYFPNE